jgi:hypothetical protein
MRLKATTYIYVDDAAWHLAYGTAGDSAVDQAIRDVHGQIQEAFTGPKWSEMNATVSEWSHVEQMIDRH